MSNLESNPFAPNSLDQPAIFRRADLEETANPPAIEDHSATNKGVRKTLSGINPELSTPASLPLTNKENETNSPSDTNPESTPTSHIDQLRKNNEKRGSAIVAYLKRVPTASELLPQDALMVFYQGSTTPDFFVITAYQPDQNLLTAKKILPDGSTQDVTPQLFQGNQFDSSVSGIAQIYGNADAVLNQVKKLQAYDAAFSTPAPAEQQHADPTSSVAPDQSTATPSTSTFEPTLNLAGT